MLLLRVRVQVGFHVYRYGDLLTIDEDDPGWAEPLAEEWVVPVDPEVEIPEYGWRPGEVKYGKRLRASPEMQAEHDPANLDAALRHITSTFVPCQPETL